MSNAQNDTQLALSQWLNAKKPEWENLELKLKLHKVDQGQALIEARDLLTSYKALMNDLSLSRRVNGVTLITRYLENLFLKAQEEIYKPSGNFSSALFDLYHQQVPHLMRQLKAALVSATLIFMAGLAAGWLLISAFPDLISLLASPKMIDEVQSGRLWTDGLLNVTPSSVLSFGIAANNITVSLTAFALGALYGIGTLYIIGLNGFMLGGIFAFTRQYGLHERLFAFIIGHGVVELSVIMIAGAMGLQLGEALIRPGSRNRVQAFQETSVNAGKIMLAAVPFLIFAGIIEGFVSPDQSYGLSSRLLIGLCSGIVFWSIMLFGLPWQARRN